MTLWNHLRSRLRGDTGSQTAEYAVIFLVAASLASVMLALVKSETVRNALSAMIQRALA